MDAFLNHTGVPSIRGECTDGSIKIQPATLPMPVCIRGDGVTPTCSVVDAEHPAIALHRGCPSWIEFNSGATGYYRTEWTPAQLNALDLSQLSAAERLMLVYDLRAAHSDSALLKKLAADPEPEIVRAVAGDDRRKQ
jgi:hypothetical protein